MNAIDTDPWIANSLLQKSIRRGAEETAQRAALTFTAMRGAAIWRRFVIIGFEDVGIGCPEAVSLAVLVSTDRALRHSIGNDQTIACNLARVLARATKSRAAEHLITGARYHFSLDDQRAAARDRPLEELVGIALNGSRTVGERAVAFLQASELRGPYSSSTKRSTELLAACDAAGVPAEFLLSAERGLLKVRDPIVLMACLAWLLAEQACAVAEKIPPRWLDLDGLPSYALDKHTLVGRRAIRDFVRYNNAVRAGLERFAAGGRLNEAAYMAAFYTDAAPLARKARWEGADDLERMAIEADLMRAGLSLDGVQPVLQAFSENLDHLNKLRAHAFFKERGSVDMAIALLRDEGGLS